MSEYWVVLFPNDTAAMQAERALKEAGVTGRMVPVPRGLSCRCGVALRLEAEAAGPGLAALQARGVRVTAVHRLVG